MESHLTLYFKQGPSDKIYQASLQPQHGGWIVSFAFGRRNTTLTTGTKTPQPIGLDEAKRIYEKLLRDKLAKGYTPGEDGPPYTETQSVDTGVRPQLLNAITLEELPALLASSDFILQPKRDGRRLLIQKSDNQIIGINRRGLECGFPVPIRDAVMTLPGDFLIDGEAVGDVFHVFDLLERNGDLRRHPYQRRYAELLDLLAFSLQKAIRLVPSFWDEEEKRDTLSQLREENAEGVVFKAIHAPYSPGRPASGGDQFKFKFVETASVVIHKLNARRSAAIAVHDGNELIAAGNVAIPSDHPIPEVGQVAEVRYLYALPESGALFQPVYLGTRDDIEPGECRVSQLKYKAAA